MLQRLSLIIKVCTKSCHIQTIYNAIDAQNHETRQGDPCPSDKLIIYTRKTKWYRERDHRRWHWLLRSKGVSHIPYSQIPYEYTTHNIRPQSRKDATKHYQDKVDYVRKNLETLQETLQRKQDNLQLVGQIMQSKIQQASQAGAARTKKSWGLVVVIVEVDCTMVCSNVKHCKVSVTCATTTCWQFTIWEDIFPTPNPFYKLTRPDVNVSLIHHHTPTSCPGHQHPSPTYSPYQINR